MSALNKPIKLIAYTILGGQLVVIAGLALILFIIQGLANSLSFIMGGLAYWLPTLFFATVLFPYAGARAAKSFLIVFSVGEVAKLLLSGLLFILAVVYLQTNPFFALLGFAASIISFWIMSLWSLSTLGGSSR